MNIPNPAISEEWIERDRNAVQHQGGGGGANTVVLSHGKGSTVWDVDGRAYLDAQGGAWLNLVGHGREELAEAAAQQMAQLAHFSIGFDYSSMPATAFAEKLIERAPDNIGRVRFTSSGGEADDHALQLVRLYHSQKDNPKRRKVLTHQGAYHGGTCGGVELAGGQPGVSGRADEIIQLTAPRPYHSELYDGHDMTDYCVDELQSVIAQHGSENMAAMFGELVIGPGGMIPLPDDYWPRMTAVLRQHGILFVADEVVTAFGRAGAWFTSNDYGLAPDIIVLAKGIASGYIPIAAVLLDSQVADVVNGVGPGNSYAGHNVGAAVASAHLDIIERENLLENSRARGAQFLDELSPLEQHPLVGTIRGRGLMIGVELVADKGSRQSLASAAPALHQELPRYVRRVHGVLLGMRASAIVLTPPLIITESEVSRICEAVIDAVNRIDPKSSTLPNSVQ
ncbi:MAG: aminotransferase class III-fold pyridoxal phosphate-dependent enzyme [Proteobacteria bacterium]|nr:aminotransferase class III-fold pyridoxal phosphate-dependent enzyme [Pseudomonadota bacterium]